ncbi:dipeptidyl-peptidase 3 family protein [Robertkochia sediminum]|uniref:dipeptidyl-peptidase 3 family protein n=1 Tax=Robertkochia sediminum TaxID=2785326 RepID=UPI0019326934|nr:Zn-dependent hydrolase [Robertkochia sediminum]MBL7471206.1 Zn-dependent hydrolase [Robertkochia sediminum]
MKKILLTGLALTLFACGQQKKEQQEAPQAATTANDPIQEKVDEFAEFTLTTDLSVLTENEKQMLPLLIEAAQLMDKLFWKEAYGDKDSLMAGLNASQQDFAAINYGPWERLNDDEPFIEGVAAKPAGAQFYPEDMTKEEFENWDNADKTNAYSFVRRDDNGELYLESYHEAFAEEIGRAAGLLREAAALCEEEGLKTYLTLRADALERDDYLASDMAWMDMKDNTIDMVVGPIENYEDKLYNYRNAHEAYVLIKDKSWSERLEKYASFLPELQKGLPVADDYKKEMPGTSSQLNAYDVIYYAGDCNAGSKTIAINLPNDERVQLEKGSRRLQLKNAMKAKFDKILLPISEVLVTEDQRKHITFDAFFANTMFHEVAHGLGIKNTINGKGTVREALKEKGSALEEGKADILGLYMVTKLHEKGEIQGELMDYYVTFIAGIFRSVRFGAASAHGQANMIRFNYFQEMDAFSYDEATGQYAVNLENFKAAMNALSEKILTLQGDGDYEGVTQLFDEMGHVSPQLQSALDKVSDAGIPRDIVFKQGISALGL